MLALWIYIILSVFIVSLTSLIGLLSFGFDSKNLQKVLIYFVSFSAGAIFGDVFLHLLPEVSESTGFTTTAALYILLGIVLFFILEKFIHWHHCHEPEAKGHKHPVTYMSLTGDAVHNFIDGTIIASSYLVSLPAGIATTLAVFFHELPHEAGNFSILLHGGFSRKRALFFNFLSALAALLGALLVIWIGSSVENIQDILIPFATGTFIYIAGSDLVPEIHKHSDKISQSFIQLLAFLAGIGLMALILLLE